MIVRRIVTGHDQAGRSVFLSDGPPPRAKRFSETPGFVLNPVWLTKQGQSAEADPTAAAQSLHAEPDGSVLLVITFPPDSVMSELDMSKAWPEHLAELPGIAERFEPEAPGMHRTDTIDYAVVLSGQIELELDDGERKQLETGDVVIQQGTRHAWRNTTDAAVTMLFCMLGQRTEARSPRIEM